MFVSDNNTTFEKLTPGTHQMKVSDVTFPNDELQWSLTFKKGGFTTKAFGKSPILKEEGTPESWAKVVGPNGGWFVSTKIFFEDIMGKEKVNEVITSVSNRITAKYPTFEEQFNSLERVKKAVKLLLTELLNAATPYFKEVWFDVDLAEYVGLDKEGNETTYLNVEKATTENGWKIPYRVCKPQPTNIATQQEEQSEQQEKIPDWVETSSRQEPLESEW